MKFSNFKYWAPIVLTIAIMSSLLIFSYKYSSTSNFQRLKIVLEKIQVIRKTNAILHESILKSRFYYLSYYDPVVTELNKTEQTIQDLETLLFKIKSKNSLTYKDKIESIKSFFQINSKQIEFFKSKNSIYKNSERYLPALLDESFQNKKFSKNKYFKYQLKKIANLLLKYLSHPGIEQKNKLIALRKEIASSSLSRHPEITQIQRHLSVLLNERLELDSLVKKIITNQMEATLTELESLIQQDITKKEKQSEVYYLLMICLITMLIGLVIISFIKLSSGKKELERKVEERTLELTKAKENSDHALETKARFLATMSHEIRTPMNAVLSCTNLLLDTVKKPEHIRLVKTIGSSGDTLLTIINDILDFSKIESGKIDLENEAFAIEDNVKETIDLLNSKASEKGITISTKIDNSTPPWIKGDVTRFRQILTNLVGNAVKFTKSKVDVVISAKSISEKYEILVSVKDNGIGMPENAKSKLFKDFSQVDASTTRKFGGTGLGLAICKGLTEAMDGKIWAESKLNFGSTFSFTFIAEKTQVSEPKKKITLSQINPEMATHHPLKILMAEDNSINQMVAKKIIGKLGYRIDVVGNGLEAVEAVKNNTYDVVLMDQHMPEMDGIEATQVIRKEYPDKPKIFALTASAFKEDKDRCLAAGMDDFLTKPININQLVSALMECEPNFNLKTKTQISELVDLESLYIQFDGATEILDEIIQQFLLDLPDYMTKIQTAIDQQDTKKIETSAHTLKGALANFQADLVVDLALKLEICGRKNNLKKSISTFNTLKQKMDLLAIELKRIRVDTAS